MHAMRVCIALTLVVGCSSSTEPVAVGTVVYSQRDTQDIRVLDLASGNEQLIDNGEHGNVSIAPDAQHVAYMGVDRVVKVADRAATISPLEPRAGLPTSATWLTPTALTYYWSNSSSSGVMLLPALGSTPRLFENRLSVSTDATIIAYVTPTGDVVVENLDGTDSRIVYPSANPTAMFPYRGVLLTPDKRRAIISDYADYPAKLIIVSLADGSAITVDSSSFGGAICGPEHFLGASMFSADSSQVVISSNGNLAILDLATGNQRPIAAFPPRMSNAGAAFLDDGRVLWARYEDKSVGDAGSYELTLRIAGPNANDDLELVNHGGCWPTIAVLSDAIALPDANLFIGLDGTPLVDNNPPNGDFDNEVIGVLPDGRGVVTTTWTRGVRIVGIDGSRRTLASGTTTPSDPGPVAAYTPATSN